MKAVTILGSTGSIGVSTLDVLARHPDRFQVYALTANGSVDAMLEQCLKFRPEVAVMLDEAAAEKLQYALKQAACDTQVLAGDAALQEVAASDSTDYVVAAIVGAAGLLPTLAAARAGKRILLANKEALVMSGALFMSEVQDNQATLLPVDSEHNAIWQCMPVATEQRYEFSGKGVRKIILTASGGPFRDADLALLEHVTPEQAVAHPNWSMGQKISVDSMRTPIANTLAWPERIDSGVAPLDLVAAGRLDFAEADFERFPCLRLAYQALDAGGTSTAILNAANEVAVAAFLQRQIKFTDIARIIEQVLNQLPSHDAGNLEQILADDGAARRLAEEMIV